MISLVIFVTSHVALEFVLVLLTFDDFCHLYYLV